MFLEDGIPWEMNRTRANEPRNWYLVTVQIAMFEYFLRCAADRSPVCWCRDFVVSHRLVIYDIIDGDLVVTPPPPHRLYHKDKEEGLDSFAHLYNWHTFALALGEALETVILLGDSSQHAEMALRVLRAADGIHATSRNDFGQHMCVNRGVVERVKTLSEGNTAWAPVRDWIAPLAEMPEEEQYMFLRKQ